ncbi:Clavaminate synthase-like protein [Auriscalpium vulgare]|uniref:Clavaminate synthase-like protein n=1 Tax=Auriscalpium vulgare TaxID=40419 RepID=A0ACB8RTE0_9AGAM|nr:Clavaminate synthase-like protein [Auriscalpium vulgare]
MSAIPLDSHGLEQPNIYYHSDRAKWETCTVHRLAEDPSLPRQPLPDGFPVKVEGPMVWEASDWTDERQWLFELAEADLQEINEALAYFKGNLDQPMGFMTQATFPLPKLSPKPRSLSNELHDGRGFFVLRTIPIDAYCKEELGIRGKQDGTGAVFGHIKDLTLSHASATDSTPFGNAAYTTEAQVFHTDVDDLVALLMLEKALEGGTSRLASTARVYNELAETRPDLVKVLAEPSPLDSLGGNPPYSMRPFLFYSDPHCTGYRAQVRCPDIPPIAEAQAEALDAVHFFAEKHSFPLVLRKGDIQFISGLGLLHARDGYTDDPAHPLHLIRLWLRNEEFTWKTPPELESVWNRIYSLEPERQRFPLDPEDRTKSKGVSK